MGPQGSAAPGHKVRKRQRDQNPAAVKDQGGERERERGREVSLAAKTVPFVLRGSSEPSSLLLARDTTTKE